MGEPACGEWTLPRYQDICSREARLFSSPDGGALVRVIDRESPGTLAQLDVYSDNRDPCHGQPWCDARAALAGRVQRAGLCASRAGSHRKRTPPDPHWAVGRVRTGDVVRITADAKQDGRHPNLDVLMFGGAPIGESVVHYGPFVMNTKDEVTQAIADYQAGRLGRITAQAVPTAIPTMRHCPTSTLDPTEKYVTRSNVGREDPGW